MIASKQCIAQIKAWEGFHPAAYEESPGVWTVGYGERKDVHRAMVCSETEARLMLLAQVAEVEEQIRTALPHIPLTQGQFDALVSWIHDCGIESFKRTMGYRDLCVEYAYEKAIDDLNAYAYDTDGVHRPKLQARRDREREWFLMPGPVAA